MSSINSVNKFISQLKRPAEQVKIQSPLYLFKVKLFVNNTRSTNFKALYIRFLLLFVMWSLLCKMLIIKICVLLSTNVKEQGRQKWYFQNYKAKVLSKLTFLPKSFIKKDNTTLQFWFFSSYHYWYCFKPCWFEYQEISKS